MADYRFVIDDGAFHFDDLDSSAISENLESLVDELAVLRGEGEPVAILGGWGSIECLTGCDLASLLTTHRALERDRSTLLLGLLGKGVLWDADAAVVVDPVLMVDDRPAESFGIRWCLDNVLVHRALAVLTMPHVGHRGDCNVKASDCEGSVSFVAGPEDHPTFYRSIFDIEETPESEFFQMAVRAFPKLVFAGGLDFGRFAGGYQYVRAQVIAHLSALNDHFKEALRLASGNSNEISARLGIDVGIEGSGTRAQESVMKLRDVQYAEGFYRCEWHSKLEPTRNRIHFHFGDEATAGRILIGIFAEHLPT